MNIGAFFPYFASTKFGFSETSIGILFSLYQVAFLSTAVYCGKHMQTYGRKRAVRNSILLMSIATLLFGLASQLSSGVKFYILSCIARVCQGAAAGVVEVAVPAIISQQFPKSNELYQGYAVMAMGLGLTLGPVIGAASFKYLTFTASMFLFALIVLTTGCYAISLLPNSLNKGSAQDKECDCENHSERVLYR